MGVGLIFFQFVADMVMKKKSVLLLPFMKYFYWLGWNSRKMIGQLGILLSMLT